MITAKSVSKVNEEIDRLTAEQLDEAIDRNDFESVLNEAKTWIAEPDRPESLNDPPPESEPLLMGCLIQNLDTHLNSLDGEARYAGYRQRVILLMIKIVILALERAASRRTEM